MVHFHVSADASPPSPTQPAAFGDNTLAKCVGPEAIVVGKKCTSEKHYVGAALVTGFGPVLADFCQMIGEFGAC